MKSGVRKSGWPMPRLMMSRPCATSALARASTAKAFSSPMRSKAAMVRSMSCARRRLGRHAGRRDLRGLQSHLVEGAANEAGGLGLFDEAGHESERGRLVLG